MGLVLGTPKFPSSFFPYISVHGYDENWSVVPSFFFARLYVCSSFYSDTSVPCLPQHHP